VCDNVFNMIQKEMDKAYQLMSENKTRETEALAWAEDTVGEITDEPWRSLIV